MKRYSRYWISLALLLLFAALLPTSPARSAVPPDFTEAVYVPGLNSPTSMAFAPDGRLFVTEQGGDVRIIENDILLATPFVSLAVNSIGERGLLGLAFDPDFATNSFLYVYYTVPTTPPHNRVSRFTAAGNQAIGGSELILLELEDLNASNHNGGALHFGPDSMLYIAVGENAVQANAQTLTNQLGKILRINPATFPVIVPPDNPFVGTPGAVETIWAFGLRNPYTFAFQPGTGLMYINDVGAGTFEEINVGSAGANYGWPNSEGPTATPGETGPVFFYPHAGPVNDSGCAITGGTFYNPPVVQFPATFVGDYFFADLCNQWIKSYDIATDTPTTFADATLGDFIVDLDVGTDGTLYYLAYNSNTVYQITYSPPGVPPTIVQDPANATVTEGQTATFSCLATGTLPITYQWQQNNVDIPGATNTSYTTPALTLTDNGATFRCITTNAFGNATSNSATLTVVAQGSPPPVPAPSGTFDIAIAKTAVLERGALGLVGEDLSWVITITNTSSIAAATIVVSDTVTSELAITGAEIDSGTVSVNGQLVTFTIPGLGAGESVEARIFTVIRSVPASGILNNTATLIASGANGSSITRSASTAFNTVTGLPSTGYPPEQTTDAARQIRRWDRVVELFAILIGGLVLMRLRRRWR